MQTRTPTKVLDPNGSNILVKNKKTRVSIFLIRSFVTTFVHKEQLHRNYFNEKKVLLPFLWLAACCMLLVTIVPHHHHIDGRICLQLSEIPENGQNRDITHRPDCETDIALRVLPLTGLLPESLTSSQIFSLHFRNNHFFRFQTGRNGMYNVAYSS